MATATVVPQDHNTAAARPASTRNASIDWIRVVSILYLTGFWHLFGYTTVWRPNDQPIFYRVTVVALALFVLISGYLLGRSPVKLEPRSLLSFWIKRLIRIYPPYLVAVIGFAIMHQLAAPALNAALLISMFTPPPPFTLWFITMIMVFYLIAPLLIVGLNRPPVMILGAAGLWCLMLLYWYETALLDVRMVLYFPAFVIGVLLARFPIRPGPLLSLLWLGAIGIAYAISLPATGLMADQSIWDLPLAIVAPPAIFCWINHRLPDSRLIQILSAGSFFLYLFHRPVYIILLKITGIADDWTRTPFLLLVCFPVAIAVGIVGQAIYDWFLARPPIARALKRL